MRRLLCPIAALALGASASADDIHLTDGTTISEVDVQTETHELVSYKKERKAGKVDSSKVLLVVYSEKPDLVDRADAAIAQDQYLDAEFDLSEFLAGVVDRVPRKHPWSRGYAFYRLVGVYEVLGDSRKLEATASQMAELEPDSRYLPIVITKQAQALADAGDSAKALAALGNLEKLIRNKGLGKGWSLELELGRILYGGGSGAALRKKLEELSSNAAGAYPVVYNRAEVAIGASLLTEGKLPEAEKIFKAVTADPKADSRTLAAAYAGLGQCLFRRGERGGDPAMLREALKSYMRVVVLYKNEVNYMPESLFFAGRCWQLLGEEDSEEKATKLYNKVIRNFPESRWAPEAKSFRG
jgi:tetratricopeptide (TPR) repeat protein